MASTSWTPVCAQPALYNCLRHWIRHFLTRGCLKDVRLYFLQAARAGSQLRFMSAAAGGECSPVFARLLFIPLAAQLRHCTYIACLTLLLPILCRVRRHRRGWWPWWLRRGDQGGPAGPEGAAHHDDKELASISTALLPRLCSSCTLLPPHPCRPPAWSCAALWAARA